MAIRLRNIQGKFKRQYTRDQVLRYLRSVSRILKKSPTYRDLKLIPGPRASTIIRKFGSWAKALRFAGIRPIGRQLSRNEKGIIRKMWRKLSDKQIARKLNLPPAVIRYYRLSSKLWKNSRKGATKAAQRLRAIKLYGKTCEICNIPIVDLNHIISKKNDPQNWTILCPLCHAALTRKLAIIQSREDLKTKLLPFMKNLYAKYFKFRE